MSTLVIVILVSVFVIILLFWFERQRSNKINEEFVDAYKSSLKPELVKDRKPIKKTKSRGEIEIEKSKTLLADKFGCDISLVEKTYIQTMMNDHVPVYAGMEALKDLRDQSSKESIELGINISNTPSALMEKWTFKYMTQNLLLKSQEILTAIPEELKQFHNREAYANPILRSKFKYAFLSYYSEQETLQILDFYVEDNISHFVHNLNNKYLVDDQDGEYDTFICNSAYHIKEEFEYFIRVFPVWFVSAYPDVVVWVHDGFGDDILSKRISKKVQERKIIITIGSSSERIDEIQNELDSSYEITISDLREIVDIYQKENVLECIGANKQHNPYGLLNRD